MCKDSERYLRFARQPNLQGTCCSLPRRAKKPALSPRHPAKAGTMLAGLRELLWRFGCLARDSSFWQNINNAVNFYK